jgi:RNA polymerase sigma-70 factor (ECF subfamily)
VDAERSFEAWYRAEHSRVFVAMLSLTGERHLAADVTAEAFARALQHWVRVSAMASPGGWTYRVAVNVLRRRQRRAAFERRLLPRLAASRAASVPGPAGEVWDLVRELPERQRTAVVLRYVADLTEPEIARAMNVTRGTVATSLARARRTLGDALRRTEETRSSVKERT